VQERSVIILIKKKRGITMVIPLFFDAKDYLLTLVVSVFLLLKAVNYGWLSLFFFFTFSGLPFGSR
jgi:hypothetical protein